MKQRPARERQEDRAHHGAGGQDPPREPEPGQPMAAAQHPPGRDREGRLGEDRVGAGRQVAEGGHRGEVEDDVHDHRDRRHPGEQVLAVDRVEHGGERRVHKEKNDSQREYAQRGLRLREQMEEAADRMREHQGPHADRPAEQDQDLEEARVTVQKPPSREEIEYARKYYNLEISPEPIPAISISFTSSGSKKWADFTARNVKRRAAIILDGIPLMAPIIQEPITSGKVQIHGNFSKEEIQSIVDRINALISESRSM